MRPASRSDRPHPGATQPSDPRFEIARLRNDLRAVETELERVRADQRFYRRMGFTDEYLRSLLVVLLDRKRDYEACIAESEYELRGRPDLPPPRSVGARPAALGGLFHLHHILRRHSRTGSR